MAIILGTSEKGFIIEISKNEIANLYGILDTLIRPKR